MKVTKERSCLVVNRVILCVIKKRIVTFRLWLLFSGDLWSYGQTAKSLLFRKLPHAKKIGTRMMGWVGKWLNRGCWDREGGWAEREERCHKVNTFSARQEQQEQSEAGATNTTITEISRHHSQKAEIPKKHLTVFFARTRNIDAGKFWVDRVQWQQ